MKQNQEYKIKEDFIPEDKILRIFYVKEGDFFTKQEARLYDTSGILIKTTPMLKVILNEPMCNGKYFKQHIDEYNEEGTEVIKQTTQLVGEDGIVLADRWVRTEKFENTTVNYINLIDVKNHIIAQEKRTFDKEWNLLSSKPTKVLDHIVDNHNGTVTLYLNTYQEDGMTPTGETIAEDVTVYN